MEEPDLFPASQSADSDLHKRLERMAHAANATRARRGKATMLQKALDPSLKQSRESEWDSCSEASCDSLASLHRDFNDISPSSSFSRPVSQFSPNGSFCRPSMLSPTRASCSDENTDDSPLAHSPEAKQLMTRLAEMGIAPIVDGPTQPNNSSFNTALNLSFSMSPFPPSLPMEGVDPLAFLCRAPPRRSIVECRIIRDNTDKRHPKFELFLEHKRQFMLAARKRKLNTTSNYLISTDREDLHRHSTNFVGKLRSNFLGTEFVIFDNGERVATETAKQRRTLGCVLYERNVLGANGPRKMHVAIPVVNEDGEAVDLTADINGSEHSNLLEHFLSGNRLGIVTTRSAEPEWVPEKRTFVLDFNGRVKKSSVKNFQLKEEGKPPVLVQFGKVDTDHYVLDFQFPFNALQAFAIALSSFDSKLACE